MSIYFPYYITRRRDGETLFSGFLLPVCGKDAIIVSIIPAREEKEGYGRMQFFLKQSTGTESLFTVSDSCGRQVYEVTGAFSSLGRRFSLRGENGVEAAKISCVHLAASAQYSVSVEKEKGEKDKVRVTVNPSAPRRPVSIRGVKWRFRGSVLTRSFDLVDEDSHTVMTHGRCWKAGGDCYAAEIPEESDVLLCLSVAVIIDSTVVAGMPAAVPAG